MSDFITNFIMADLRMATPILFGALGELYTERSGVINIGIEGFMLLGALIGSMSSYFFNNAWLGVIIAALVCGVLGLIYAFFVVTIKANQVAGGIAINILILGLTTTIYRRFMGINICPPSVATFKNIPIPLLSKIPILGQSIFNQTMLTYLALMLVPFTYYFLYKTSIGLKIRAVGEYPQAADTAGVNVFQIRYGSIIGGSMLMGVGGAYLSLGALSIFTENMVAGKGFIALAIIRFGKWNPWGILGTALFFTFSDALAIRLQIMGSSIPHHFLLMLPYIFTVVALTGVRGKSIAPAAMCKPYNKE